MIGFTGKAYYDVTIVLRRYAINAVSKERLQATVVKAIDEVYYQWNVDMHNFRFGCIHHL